MIEKETLRQIDKAIEARASFFDDKHESAFRIFNGFSEGCSDLVLDVFGKTIVVHNHSKEPASVMPLIEKIRDRLTQKWTWVEAMLVKAHHAKDRGEATGVFVVGKRGNRKIMENGVWYALDLQLNRDASLYLDARNLRKWAKENLAGKSVLNTFAYTGSLGVAAAVGGASKVINSDINKSFLNVGKDSYSYNSIPIEKSDFLAVDFWAHAKQLNRAGKSFDCVILDPPFFAQSRTGNIDLAKNMKQLINKVRPLVNDGGWLVVVNNAAFVGGEDFLVDINALCEDGYLAVEKRINVPMDCTGYPATRVDDPIVDPSPFNHSTKIVVLKVKRKA
jgi:23S rRNA (cytosine1962-C5)-methyltransferase